MPLPPRSAHGWRRVHLTFFPCHRWEGGEGYGTIIYDAPGLPHCRAHGLRKAAARRLGGIGATAPQIKSWTGHKSDREVQRYIEAASQAKMNADSAHLLATQAERLARFPLSPTRKGNE